jgi:hypothetical protein
VRTLAEHSLELLLDRSADIKDVPELYVFRGDYSLVKIGLPAMSAAWWLNIFVYY